MYQGGEGSWRYQMAFTTEPGEGVYIQLFYLFLGHVARILSLPMVGVFHAARLLCALILLGVLWKFFGVVLPKPRHRRFAFSLAALGSGMGWLGILMGLFPSDMWVAEAYPFLSAYANPHFVISLTLVLWLAQPTSESFGLQRALSVLLAAFVLSLVSPFGVVVILMILGGQLLISGLVKKAWLEPKPYKDQVLNIAVIVLGGAPFLLYYFWITQTHDVIAAWNAQNLTPSPQVWDLVLSLSPALLFAVLGAWGLIRKYGRTITEQRIFPLVIWVGFGLVLMYLPFGLQRRFMMGLYIPLAGLCALGLDALSTERRPYRFWATLLFMLAVPTNLIVLMAGVHGINQRDEALFLTSAEDQTLTWIEAHTDPDDVVLAGPEMGSLIPAFTGRRVIYGHPFETIYAEREEEAVTAFFEGHSSAVEIATFLDERGVDYVFYGPREQRLGSLEFNTQFSPVLSTDDVVLYQVGE